MHLHRLRMAAFGPFGGEVDLDFDELSGAGLFLFTGPTGAGKSSVLDAVCFGLYGVVPGPRQAARQLRSDHAAPGVAPMVELEFSVAGRRFLIRRSPAWQRPKRRGTGFTAQPAAVTLEEHQDGSWHTLSTRLDETGDLIGTLLGMQAGQFTQVAMLPQGEFQQFLCAKSDERQAILQRLFRTDRFEAVERWLRERRNKLRARSESALHEISAVLNRIHEAAGGPRPDILEPGELPAAIGSGAAGQWLAQLVNTAELALDAAVAAVARNTAEAEAARVAHHKAATLADLQQRGRAANETLRDLAKTRDDADAEAARLEADRRAQPALALAREHHQAQDRLNSVRVEVATQLDQLGLPAELSLAAAQGRLDRCRRTLHAIQDFAPQQRSLDQALSRHRDLTSTLAGISASLPHLTAELDELPARRQALNSALADAERAAGEQHALQASLAQAREGLQAAGELGEVSVQLSKQQSAWAAAVQHHLDLRQAYLDLREARINAMAGELAAELAVGCSCPVCGSQTHPHPATPTVGVGPDAEDAARAEMDNAAIAAEALHEAVRTLQHRKDTLEVIASGRDVEAWSGELAQCEARLQRARALAEQLTPTRTALDALARRETELTAAVSAARAESAQLTTRLGQLAGTIAEVRGQLQEVLADTPYDDLDSASRHLGELTRGLQDLVALLAEAESSARAERLAARAVMTEAVRAGFTDRDEAEAAALPAAERERLLQRLREREHAEAGARAVLAEDDIEAALATPAPDLTTSGERADRAESERDLAVANQSRLSLRADRLAELATCLDEAIDRWSPLFESFQLASGLADLLEGRAADNEFRMRLSAYVLSERLRQVVDAANDRLARMGRDRFTLEQSDQGAARDRRGGLALRVRDAWTSTERETGTLSGGESFMVSLALALGLADTVTAESGGTRIETLFVDEGFGSLDAESLEGVLDTLDTLREGGRAVGVVSHVAEMRERIPTQVQISSTPQHGATLRVVAGV